MIDQVSTDEATATRYENSLFFHLILFLLSFDWPCQSESSYLSVYLNENETANRLGVWLMLAIAHCYEYVAIGRWINSQASYYALGRGENGQGPRRRSRMYLFGGTIQPRS
jgi:hypothetical protein